MSWWGRRLIRKKKRGTRATFADVARKIFSSSSSQLIMLFYLQFLQSLSELQIHYCFCIFPCVEIVWPTLQCNFAFVSNASILLQTLHSLVQCTVHCGICCTVHFSFSALWSVESTVECWVGCSVSPSGLGFVPMSPLHCRCLIHCSVQSIQSTVQALL